MLSILDPALVAARVSERLSHFRMSASELSRRSNISRSRISELLAGKRNRPSLGVILSVARALECDLDYLIGLSDDPNTSIPAFFLPITHRAHTGTFVRPMPSIAFTKLGAPRCESYADRPHFAVIIDDETMSRNDPPLPRGFVALCVDLEGLPVMDREDYVVQVSDDGGKTFETTIRHVRHVPGGTELLAFGDQPVEPRRLGHVLDTDRTKDVFAIGFVYGTQHLKPRAGIRGVSVTGA